MFGLFSLIQIYFVYQEHKSSDPLALEQFLSAFLLLMAGILMAALLLLLEHLYFKYIRKHLAKTDRGGCCALISLSMGKSLTFRGMQNLVQQLFVIEPHVVAFISLGQLGHVLQATKNDSQKNYQQKYHQCIKNFLYL